MLLLWLWCLGDSITFETEAETVQDDPQLAEFQEWCADDVQ